MWEINNLFQLLGFVYSILLGGLFSFIYDFVKSFRLTLKFSSLFIFILDILYFLSISFLTFLFYISFTDGEIRYYILLGMILGFIIFRITVSKVLIFLLIHILKFIFLITDKLNGYILVLNGRISSVLKEFFKNILKIFKKIKNNLKKDLKSDSVLLYTNEE